MKNRLATPSLVSAVLFAAISTQVAVQAEPDGFSQIAPKPNSDDELLGMEKADEAFDRKEFTTAISLYLPLATKGNRKAQHRIGFTYATGSGVPQNYAEALEWYRKAADQGYAAAENNIGSFYANGLGVTKDSAEALKWYLRASDHGSAEAESNIGAMYLTGQGTSQDFEAALAWSQKAANHGNSEAANNIGTMYEKGQGVSQDYDEAARWYRRAAEGGSTNGLRNLKTLRANGLGLKIPELTDIEAKEAVSRATAAQLPKGTEPKPADKATDGKKYASSIVPIEKDALLYKDGIEDIKLINQLVSTVRLNGFKCDSVSAARPQFFSVGFVLTCNEFLYEYDITDKGGHWIVIVR